MNLNYDQNQLMKTCHTYGISQLSLFGSYANGNQTIKSDIDLLVTYSPTSKVKSLLDHLKVQEEFESIFQNKVDLIEKNALNSRLKPYVLRNTKVLYEG